MPWRRLRHCIWGKTTYVDKSLRVRHEESDAEYRLLSLIVQAFGPELSQLCSPTEPDLVPLLQPVIATMATKWQSAHAGETCARTTGYSGLNHRVILVRCEVAENGQTSATNQSLQLASVPTWMNIGPPPGRAAASERPQRDNRRSMGNTRLSFPSSRCA